MPYANRPTSRSIAAILAVGLLTTTAALAQTALAQTAPAPPASAAPPAPAAPPRPAPAASAPEPLKIYFDSGSAAIHDAAELDHAARLYTDGKPIVMVVTGATDSVGPAGANLHLAQMRANAVLQALVARGIPADRFQVLAKGETDPAVAVPVGTAEPRNRVVEITWR